MTDIARIVIVIMSGHLPDILLVNTTEVILQLLHPGIQLDASVLQNATKVVIDI